MSWHSIIDATVILHSWLDREAKQQVHVCAQLPNHDYDNERIDVLDWKIFHGSANSVAHLRYRFSPSDYAQIFDTDLPVVTERFDIPKPNKSKHWVISEYEDCWKNTKTGKKVPI